MAAVNKKIQVAVADDHSLLRQALAKLINSFENFSVLFEANNGNEIKAKLGKHIIPDIVLLDVNMPDMDGFEVLELLAKDPKKYGNVKTICISAMHFDNSKEEGCLELCDYYLEKPVDKTQLLEKVASCFTAN